MLPPSFSYLIPVSGSDAPFHQHPGDATALQTMQLLGMGMGMVAVKPLSSLLPVSAAESPNGKAYP
jgi:hypothetical protein